MKNMKKIKPFRFKQFEIYDNQCAMKVGTDGVLLGAWANIEQEKRILDIGTGSGLIALMMAQRNKKALITGIEIDAAASEQAMQNVARSAWAERVRIQHISLQDFVVQTDMKFQHIVSNPPYFEMGTLASNLTRQQARQRSELSFFDLIFLSKKILEEEGKISVILPTKEGLSFTSLAHQHGFFLSRKWNVKPKKEKNIERVLLEFSLTPPSYIIEETIIIQHEKRNDWTEEYIRLTGAFYLKM